MTVGQWQTDVNTGTKNVIINGNFDFWQRGTSLSAGTSLRYLADRWTTKGTGSTVAPSRQSFTLGQSDVPGEPVYFHRSVVVSSSGVNNYARMSQRIEGVRTFANQTCTLSFYAKADAAKNIAVEFIQFFGTGGTPSTTVDSLGIKTCALTTSWQKFTATVTLPSLSGKTLGTDLDYLGVLFWFDAGSTYNSRTNSLGQQSGTFDIAQVQLEVGSIATSFEKRSPATELMLCQRYYEQSYGINVPPGTATTSGMDYNQAPTQPNFFVTMSTAYYKVHKRSIPTGTIYDSLGNSSRCEVNGAGWQSQTIAATHTNTNNITIQSDLTIQNFGMRFHWTAEAEL